MVRSDCPYTLDVRAKARGQREWLFTAIALLSIIAARPSKAQTCSAASLPYTLTNGSTADASQVIADINCAGLYGLAHAGNVGIGTTTPSTQLDVNGGILSENGLIVSHNLLLQGDGSNAYIRPINSGSNLYLGAANSDYVAINSSGSVGIGLNPYYRLDILTNNNNYDGMRVWNSSGGAQATTLLQFGNDTNGTSADIGLNSSMNSNFGAPNTFWLVNGLNAPLVLGTSFQPRITIDGSGNVGVGTSTPGYLFQVNGLATGNDAWVNLSDARLKTNIAPITNALDMIMRLRGVRFQWRAASDRSVGKELKLNPTQTHVGFIAQEVQAILPEAVASPKDSNGLYGLKEADLIPVLVQAIKEQQAEIEALKALVSASKSSN